MEYSLRGPQPWHLLHGHRLVPPRPDAEDTPQEQHRPWLDEWALRFGDMAVSAPFPSSLGLPLHRGRFTPPPLHHICLHCVKLSLIHHHSPPNIHRNRAPPSPSAVRTSPAVVRRGLVGKGLPEKNSLQPLVSPTQTTRVQFSSDLAYGVRIHIRKKNPTTGKVTLQKRKEKFFTCSFLIGEYFL